MYFIISHFTKNLGTTDYLLEYFRKKQKSYLYLRHPFQSEQDLQYSELIEFDGKKERIISKYKKSNNFLIEMIRNCLLTFYISIKFFKKYQKVIGFGGFNSFPILWSGAFRKTTYFWGVDYSRKRFGNFFLNQVYLFLETLGCMFSSRVISSSERQKEARIKKHFAKEKKSIVINNGVTFQNFEKNFFQNSEIGFFYLGSITHQHGILDFINYFYIKNNCKNILYIIGGGELETSLKNIISKNNLSQKIHFLGRKNKSEIMDFLMENDKKLFGIAPYSDKVNDHVFYGDSLKLREYLGYNLPFLVSSIPSVSSDLQKFGIIFETFKDIDMQSLYNFSFDIVEKNKILEKYTWDYLFSKEFF